MKGLIKQYMDSGISRRTFLTGLGALGITASAAESMARSLDPYLAQSADAKTGEAPPSWMREVKGTGAALLVAQLKASGVEYVFYNPSSGAVPFYDALVDEPSIHLIHGLQEGAIVAMADGYAKASGKTPFVICARPGFPNAMTQMFNSWKDQLPMVVVADYTDLEGQGEDGLEDSDHMEAMAQSVTKWYWMAESVDKVPEITRRAMKFAATPPCAPVFLALPTNTLNEQTKAMIMDQSKFTVSMKVRPDAADVERTARMLLEAENPALLVGDEVTWCGAQKEVVELAELLNVPVLRNRRGWSYPFPSQHPLYVGNFLVKTSYPAAPDLVLNLGSRLPFGGEKVPPSAKLIQVRLDSSNLGRTAPSELAMVGDIKLTTVDLIAALKSLATNARLKQIRDKRSNRTAEYTGQMREFRKTIAEGRRKDSQITFELLALELEASMEKDGCYVSEQDSGLGAEGLMSLGGSDKQYYSYLGDVLGWGLPAAFGVKLAQPDRQVVTVVGDGAFLFAGPQPLWSFARYSAPVTIIVGNNHSYNNERNRMWNAIGREFQEGKDMACYLGDPDIDYAKAAAAFGVKGEVVTEPSALRAALQRAKNVTAGGEPYLLDVHVEREGIGFASNWHPPFSVADLRRRKV